MTESPVEPTTCASCGYAFAPDKRFCTRCGAAAAPGDFEPAAPPSLPPAPPRQPRWALDTPPANERWWHNPVVIVGTVVALVMGGGGAAAWRFFLASGQTDPLVRALSTPADADASAGTAADTPSEPLVDVSTVVLQIQRVLVRSERGRIAVVQRRDYGAALRNREALVATLDEIEVPAAPENLARAYATLRAALEASADADAQHLACGCDALQPADHEASALKRRFAIEFDPYARAYLGGPVDPNRI